MHKVIHMWLFIDFLPYAPLFMCVALEHICIVIYTNGNMKIIVAAGNSIYLQRVVSTRDRHSIVYVRIRVYVFL